jgi:hypothetical protein
MSLLFDVHVTVHRYKFLIIEPTRCANVSKIYFWNETLHVSDSSCVHHQEFFTVHTAMLCHTGLLTACEQLYDIYHCCVHSEKLLMMDKGTVRNM